jgi:hypothetical protein
MKVYLSSTFRDLREHRAAVDRTLRRMGHDVIGMEQYAAEGSRPVERCKRDVEAADSYLLILGWRYGYVPTELNPEELSITEIEYRHALANRKTVLAFLLDPETPWPPSEMDSASADTAAAVAIVRLRSEVGSEFLAGIFSSPGDLASQVAAAVASQGMTTSLSELVLNRSNVNAASMGGFGTGGQLHDTSVLAIKDMIRDAGKDRAIVISLGDGDTWWSTRLFLLASLLRSLTPVGQIVFTGRGGRFAGMASPAAVLDGMGARFRVLDAFTQQLRLGQPSEDRGREVDRQLESWNTIFAQSRSRPPARTAPRTGADHIPAVMVPASEQDAQVGVREELLHGWLGERLISRCIQVQGRLSMSQVQQIVDCLVPDVPLEILSSEETRGGFATPPAVTARTAKRAPRAQMPVRTLEATGSSNSAEPSQVEIKVIDRDAFALELAREWVRTGLPRNPAL